MTKASPMTSLVTPVRRPRQYGNTLIGIIIGLVIGLSIAVVVALMITKGAMPFTDKQSKGKPIEPAGNQIRDPNKPMYGNKDAAREAAKETADEAKPETKPAAIQPLPKQEAKPAADPLAQVIAGFKPDPAPKADKKAAPAPAQTAAPAAPAAPAKADATDEKWIYYLQAGAFREVGDAENARAKLALLGFEAAVSDRSTDSGVLHRVRMGPYTAVEAMNRARSKLSENGIDVAVIRNQK